MKILTFGRVPFLMEKAVNAQYFSKYKDNSPLKDTDEPAQRDNNINNAILSPSIQKYVLLNSVELYPW